MFYYECRLEIHYEYRSLRTCTYSNLCLYLYAALRGVYVSVLTLWSHVLLLLLIFTPPTHTIQNHRWTSYRKFGGASERKLHSERESQTITVRNCSPDSGLIKSWSLEKQSPDKGRSARQVQTKIKNKRVRNVSVLWWLTCPHLSFNTCGGGLHGSLFVS